MSSTTFTLNNVNIIQMMLSRKVKSGKPKFIDSKDSISSTIIDDDTQDITISELLHDKSKRCSYFLDTRKIQHKYWANMVDVTENGPLPINTSKPCWWCRHPFYTTPIGCPLRYYPHSENNPLQKRFEEKMKEANYKNSTNDFFETEGLFCSFPCCKAYIISQKSNVKYKESCPLLTLLYKNLMDNSSTIFPEAPHWSILKDYGGHLSIEEFRASFGQLEFIETVNVKRPLMFCTSSFIQEKRVKK